MKAALILLLTLSPAFAHDGYKNWINKADQGCCDAHDCKPIDDDDVDEGALFTRVRIEGEWCVVYPNHYLRQGNAPDWSTAHVCVQRTFVNGTEVKKPGLACYRLKCFQPKPQG